MPDRPGRTSDPRGRTRGGRVRVKTARGRKLSSKLWLERQLNDPYVAEAKRLGYRSRAAFKIRDIDDKYSLFKSARRIVDLGAAPGGWTQIAVERTRAGAEIVGIDLLEMEPIGGATLLVGDFMSDAGLQALHAALGGPADLVLSDMANSATGHRRTDQLRTMALAEAAHDFAREILAPGGGFVAKVLQGGADADLLAALRQDFAKVHHVKPPSSRADSTEWYVVARGFRGLTKD
jgi:23S rRNA (uridine2552-2'-O)-methyltransferase